MTEHFADRLLEAIAEKNAPVCVGVDPRFDRLPAALREGAETPAEQCAAIGRFCSGVLEAVAPHVPAVKPQSAYFEAWGPLGVETYFRTVRRARELGLLVIGDVKRNDIGSTAEAYAAAHLAGPDAPDAVTVNGYFGLDGLAPFLYVARDEGKGVFTLVRTSNPSAGQVQDFADAEGTKLFEHVGRLVATLGGDAELIGERGFSCLGAVVGATWPGEAEALRKLMPQQVFLVPGYGAQGGTAADCRPAFGEDGTGAIVNASRSVIYAFEDDQSDWQTAVAEAGKAFAADIRGVVE